MANNLESTRFTNTPVKDRKLDIWVPPSFTTPVDETYYTIPRENEGRSDKIAQDVYGDPTLDWIILLYNNILDPFKELKSGNVIKIPALESISWQQ